MAFGEPPFSFFYRGQLGHVTTRIPFDPDLDEEELSLLAYLQKRGGLRPEELILRERTGHHPDTATVLARLEGSWLRKGRRGGTLHWQLLSLAATSGVLRCAGVDPPHHRHRTRLPP